MFPPSWTTDKQFTLSCMVQLNCICPGKVVVIPPLLMLSKVKVPYIHSKVKVPYIENNVDMERDDTLKLMSY